MYLYEMDIAKDFINYYPNHNFNKVIKNFKKIQKQRLEKIKSDELNKEHDKNTLGSLILKTISPKPCSDRSIPPWRSYDQFDDSFLATIYIIFFFIKRE